jgi:hypothetical protein|tara:strand:+ start:328 stop:852 length:525 start_codon:yes stop_codon:yes gene_type:complete
MANIATMTINSVLLPDVIQKKTTAGSFVYSPKDSTEGWYFQVTNISTSANVALLSTDSFLAKGPSGNIGTNSATAMATVHADDIVKFLHIQHLALQGDGSTGNTADSIYLTLDANSSNTNADIDSIEIGHGETWFAKLNCKVSDLLARSQTKQRGSAGANTIQAVVTAIIDDVA